MPAVARHKALTSKHMMLRRTQNQFRRACDQIVILNRKMELVLNRYHRAREMGARCFRYKLRLRLAIVEGVRNMFYEFANRKAHNIVNLRRNLFGEIVEIVTNEDRDDVIDMDEDDSVMDDEYEDDIDDEDEEEELSEDEDDGDREELTIETDVEETGDSECEVEEDDVL